MNNATRKETIRKTTLDILNGKTPTSSAFYIAQQLGFQVAEVLKSRENPADPTAGLGMHRNMTELSASDQPIYEEVFSDLIMEGHIVLKLKRPPLLEFQFRPNPPRSTAGPVSA